LAFALKENQPSGWFFYACEILGLLCSPFATQGRSYRNRAILEIDAASVGAALCRDGPQSGPKILNKKYFSDDWQVLEPPCKENCTNVVDFSQDFRFGRIM
jgi:hypothetical protein